MIKKAYKLLEQRKGKLYPMYVFNDEETKTGVWIEAKNGIILPSGRVKAKSGELCYRPGWHLAPVPDAPWIGKKTEDGRLVRRTENVWCEVEYLDDTDYSEEAYNNGWKNGKWAYVRAYLKHIPKNGFYMYQTNPMGREWIIAGNMRIIRVLTDEEVKEICLKNNIIPQETEKEYLEEKHENDS